jgi:hypothetical protein
MRAGILLSALLLGLTTTSLDAQTKKSTRDLERFDLSGLPAAPNSDAEHQIFTLLRTHRKGDLTDATRIHMLLAGYYRDIGDKRRAADCTRMAGEAYAASNNAAPETAGAEGTPPFSPLATFRRTLAYTDDLKVTHTWDFFVDGSFSHAVSDGKTEGPKETGWYTREGRKLRLWQERPSVDRTVEFDLVGLDGSEGAIMAGNRMKPVN